MLNPRAKHCYLRRAVLCRLGQESDDDASTTDNDRTRRHPYPTAPYRTLLYWHRRPGTYPHSHSPSHSHLRLLCCITLHCIFTRCFPSLGFPTTRRNHRTSKHEPRRHLLSHFVRKRKHTTTPTQPPPTRHHSVSPAPTVITALYQYLKVIIPPLFAQEGRKGEEDPHLWCRHDCRAFF